MGHPLFARISGDVKVSLFESASGQWTAQTGYGYATGTTKEEALTAVRAVVKEAEEQEAIRNAAAREAEQARRVKRSGKECMLAGCDRVMDTPAHRLTAKHKNAVAWDNHQRYGT